jgi:hypothetical protein
LTINIDACVVKHLPQPYLVALWSAFLAALVSGIGHLLAENKATREMAFKDAVYLLFLKQFNQRDLPELTRLVSLGHQMPKLATDSDFQDFEYRAAKLLKNQGIDKLQWQFDTVSLALRIGGSLAIKKLLDDIEKALSSREDEIDWQAYGQNVANFYRRRLQAEETGSPYGYDELTTSQERLMIATTGVLFEFLFEQMRREISHQDPAFELNIS